MNKNYKIHHGKA